MVGARGGSLGFKIAEKLVDRVVTSSEHGFRIPSRKVRIIGQGIPTDVFVPAHSYQPRPFTIITVGRLKSVKRFQDVVDAASLLALNENLAFAVRIIGATELGDTPEYQREIEQQIRVLNLEKQVTIEGDVPQEEMPRRYQSSDVMVNLGETGSMDKVVLEAMACGIPVLSANEAYSALLSEVDHRLVVEKRNPRQLTERLQWLYALSQQERSDIGRRLRAIVVHDHSLDALGRKIVEQTQLVP